MGEVFRELAVSARLPDCGGSPDAGSYPHVHQHPPEVLDIGRSGLYQGQKRDHTIARNFGGRQRNFTGESFWARGYFVSTVGLDEAMVRAYIRHQEVEDERYDQMKLSV